MERRKASDFPQELLDLLTDMCTARRAAAVSRRRQNAVGGVTAAALLEMLRPNYAWAMQVQNDDKRIKATPRPCRRRRATAASRAIWSGRPMHGKLPVVLVIHENRGLNPYIEDVARRLATAGFMAFAPDG